MVHWRGNFISDDFHPQTSVLYSYKPWKMSTSDQPLHVEEISQGNLEWSEAKGTQEFIPQTPNVCGGSQWVQLDF